MVLRAGVKLRSNHVPIDLERAESDFHFIDNRKYVNSERNPANNYLV